MNAINPVIPFNLPITGGIHPGKMIKMQGFVPHTSNRFAINLLCSPMGDVALHICPKFDQKCIVRSIIQNNQMGFEESSGPMPLFPGQNFEVIILCEPQYFKIAFNGMHFAEFIHRLPYSAVTNIAVDGQVVIYSISFDQNAYCHGNIGLVIPSVPGQATSPYMSGGMPYSAPYPIGISTTSSSGSPYLHNNNNNNNNNVYPAHVGSWNVSEHPSLNPYPPSGYPPSSLPCTDHVQSQQSQGMYPHSTSQKSRMGLLDKAGMAVTGVMGSAALLGGKKALKKQMKAHKKALKYGLPLAGVGIGAYALHKGFRGFHHSSSSSSSSSD